MKGPVKRKVVKPGADWKQASLDRLVRSISCTGRIPGDPFANPVDTREHMMNRIGATARILLTAALLLLGTVAAAQENAYAYDPAGRLVTADHGPAGRESFAWNRAGGMTSVTVETGRIALHVVVSPDGAGNVTGTGIACPADCGRESASPFSVDLTAAPASGWRFAGWGGAASGAAPTTTVSVTGDATAVAYFAHSDGATDGDDVDDTLEMGPDGDDPAFDGDGDGIPDYQEARVASFPSYRGGRYLTVEAPPGIVLAHAAAVDNPSPSDAPVDLFPLGFLELTFSGMVPGTCFTANLFMPEDPELVEFWEYGPTPSDTTDHWWYFDFANGRGARFHHNGDRMRIALAYCDGSEGDADLTADGTVVDPGGPAVTGEPELVVTPRTPWIPGLFDDYFLNEFPLTPVGSWSEIVVDIVNIGHGAAGIGPVTFLGEPSSNDPTITREEENCSWRTLPAGGRCTIRLRFTPDDASKHNSTLIVEDQDPYNPTTLVSIFPAGTGTSDPDPDPVDAHFLVQGQGRITSTVPGVDCTGECTTSVPAGAFPADFTATPMAGWRFRQWIWRWENLNAGSYEWAALDYRNPVTIRTSSGFLAFPSPMNNNPTGPPSLVAVFEEIPTQHTLTVVRTGDGGGEVVASSAGLSCGTDCAVPVAEGETVTLTASPFPGSVFEGFSGGGCSGTGPCTVTVTAPVTITATFGTAPDPTAELTVVLDGLGSGTVESNPTGINCPGNCSATLTPGTRVRLEAAPASGVRFAGWVLDGDALAGTGPLELTVETATFVIARFEPEARSDADLSVRSCGPGSGRILSAPGGIACNPECSARFPAGETIVLIADPDAGSTFGGWSGGACPGTGPCTLTLDDDTTIAAGFGDGSTVRGDVTGDAAVSAADDLAVLAWLFTAPVPSGDPPDASWDCRTDAADMAFVIAHRTVKTGASDADWLRWEALPPGIRGEAAKGDGSDAAAGSDSGDAGPKATPIPVLGWPGALLLVLLLLTAGMHALRRP